MILHLRNSCSGSIQVNSGPEQRGQAPRVRKRPSVLFSRPQDELAVQINGLGTVDDSQRSTRVRDRFCGSQDQASLT